MQHPRIIHNTVHPARAGKHFPAFFPHDVLLKSTMML